MPHTRVPAVSAAAVSFALGAAAILSAPSAHADVVQIFSGATQFVRVAGDLPDSDVHGPFSKTQSWDSLNEFRDTSLIFVPHVNSLSTVEAFGSSGDLRNNGHLMSVSVDSDLSTSRGADLGLFSTSGFVSNTAADTIGIFTDNPDDHRAITLHKTLLILGGAGESLQFNDAVQNPDYVALAHSTLRLTGDGIGESPFGGTDFGDFTFSQDPKSGRDSFQDHILSVDFTLDMHLNEFQNFSINMSLSQSTTLQDHSGGAINLFDVTSGYSLSWADDTFVTDDATGDFLHGGEFLSDSNFGYFARDVGRAGEILAPPSDGEGGVGGVPEPASWALMIGGFGMAGATLRRRRRDRSAAVSA